MAMLQKMASIDAQMRLLAPKKVSEDDKLIEYDALLLDRFLDIVEVLHGQELKETVLAVACLLPFAVVFVFFLSLSEWLQLELDSTIPCFE
jgi:hypothetical protein